MLMHNQHKNINQEEYSIVSIKKIKNMTDYKNEYKTNNKNKK